MITNEEKREVYINLKQRLKKALANEFWFEACMIEYAIIEDRTSSVLAHTGICKNAYDSNKKLSNKLSSIEYQLGKSHPIISAKMDKKIIDDIRLWKDRRNDIAHRACIIRYEDTAIKDIALEGKELVERISNASAKISRLAEKTK